MEVVGSVAATLQLAQAMGVTLLKVREAYSQIMDIDDFLHDFDGQLDVTRTTIAILQDGIGNGEFDASTKDWWRQSDLERLLRSCHQHYQRVNDIFIKIARQRSSATALRAWIRTKRYDSDISHLRLCINTCTNALQLLVIIHKIHTAMQFTSERPIPGEAFVLMEEGASRLTKLESSLKDTRDDLKKRAAEQDSNDLILAARLTLIDRLMESLKLDLSRLTSSQHHQASSTEKGDIRARLAQMQDAISKLRIESLREGKRPDTSLSLQEIKDKTDMEKNTRSMLELVDDLVGSAKDHISIIDSMSTVSKVTSQPPAAPRDAMWTLVLPNPAGLHPGPQLAPVQFFQDSLKNIAGWFGRTDEDDRASVISRLSGLHPPPSETIATSTTCTSATTRTEHSFRGEINQRRIRAVEESMKRKDYGEAVGLLEILLSDGSEPLDDQEQDRLCQFLAKAIVEGKRKVDTNFYRRLPLLKLTVAGKECHWNLMQATEALDRRDYDEVLIMLDESQFQFEEEWASLSLPESEIKAIQKIQLARGQSWFYASSFWDIAATIRILEKLLEDTSLAKSDRAVAHRTLTKAYRVKCDYTKSKYHGEQAYKNMIDIGGHDDDELHELIQLLVIICSEAQDPDRDIWREILPEGLATSSWSVKRPFKAREGLDTCFASEVFKYLDQVVDEKEGRHRLHPGLEYLQHYYYPQDSGSYFRMYDMPCWDCLQHYFKPYSMVGGAGFSGYKNQDFSCERHRVFGMRTRGFSIIHFFAIAKSCLQNNPRYLNSKKKQVSADITASAIYPPLKEVSQSEKLSYSEECLDEISILLHTAQSNEPRDLQWARSRYISTGNFRMHDLINRPMDLQLPKHLHCFAKAIVVTPVWAAALSGKLRTVSFFLSLQETDAARGSDSILLLGRPELRQWPLEPSSYEIEKAGYRDVLNGILQVFNTLPVRVARQLLSRPLHSQSHWCFVESSFLGKVLDKCGKDSADLRVWSPVGNFRKVLSKSLLAFFFFLVTLDYEQPSHGQRIRQPKSVLRALLKHSQETRQDSSRLLIDLISDVVQGKQLRGHLSPHSNWKIVNWLDLWIDLIAIYINNGGVVGSDNVLKLERCIDHLAHLKQSMENNREEENIISAELERDYDFQFQRVFGMSNKRKVEQLLQRRSELASERHNLEGMMRVRERLENITLSLGSSHVHRIEHREEEHDEIIFLED